jgi:hypothetical protein
MQGQRSGLHAFGRGDGNSGKLLRRERGTGILWHREHPRRARIVQTPGQGVPRVGRAQVAVARRREHALAGAHREHPHRCMSNGDVHGRRGVQRGDALHGRVGSHEPALRARGAADGSVLPHHPRIRRADLQRVYFFWAQV